MHRGHDIHLINLQQKRKKRRVYSNSPCQGLLGHTSGCAADTVESKMYSSDAISSELTNELENFANLQNPIFS